MDDRKYSVEQITSKIQKLLNLASDPNANEHIAEQAAAKAQELMQQWAIDESALRAAGNPGLAMEPFITEDVSFLGGKSLEWEGQLAMGVASAMMTHCFRNLSKGCRTFAGRERDVKMAVFLFIQLRTTLETLSRRRLSEHGAETKLRTGKSIYNAQQCRTLSGCHPTVYRQRWLDSWLTGAQRGIRAKLVEQQQTTVAQSSSALVVVEKRREEAEEWASVEFGLVTGKARKARKAFDGALTQGYQDGQAIELRKGLTANEALRLKGES